MRIILDLSRGCVAIIDAIASALIAALNIYEEENEVRSPGPTKGSKSQEYEKNSRESKERYEYEYLMRNYNGFNGREVNDDWSTMHFYPDRKCELDRFAK